VERVLGVLEAFALVKSRWRVSELARHTGIPRSTVSYILRSTTRLGFTELTASGSYKLGLQFYKMALSSTTRYGLRRFVREVMKRMVQQCGETVYLCLHQDGDLFFFDRVDGPSPIRYHPELAGPYYLHAGAVGKAVLAFLPPQAVEKVLAGPLPRITDRTTTDPARLRKELQLIREQGYGVSVGERVEGAVAVAAPVITQEGRVVGSLVVSLPAARFSPERCRELGRVVKEGAKELGEVWEEAAQDTAEGVELGD